MCSKELENLIQVTLEDGKLTEQEKKVLLQRAQKEGIDVDEFEIYLQSLLQKHKKSNSLLARIKKSDSAQGLIGHVGLVAVFGLIGLGFFVCVIVTIFPSTTNNAKYCQTAIANALEDDDVETAIDYYNAFKGDKRDLVCKEDIALKLVEKGQYDKALKFYDGEFVKHAIIKKSLAENDIDKAKEIYTQLRSFYDWKEKMCILILDALKKNNRCSEFKQVITIHFKKGDSEYKNMMEYAENLR